MKDIALIVSLKFRAAHISHLIASYKQFTDLGYKAILYVAPQFVDYLPKGFNYVTDISGLGTVKCAIFWFPALKNFSEIIKLRIKHKAKVLYVFHEPIEKFSTYIKSGNSWIWTVKFFFKYYASLSFLLVSNKILLPSKKAIDLYRNSIARIVNTNYSYLPLLFDDECKTVNDKRKYFSYIGTVCYDHAYPQYIAFVYKLSKDASFNADIKFLIATRFTIERTKEINEMIDMGKLTIVDGKPMTDEEVNGYYASSFAVWNAYNRTTQSGVLAKAFMFGTPAIVLRKNLSEFVQDKFNVVACGANDNYNELKEALICITNDFERLSRNARESFAQIFYYKNHTETMRGILDTL